MEETLRSCNANLSTHIDIYRKINFPCQSTPFDIDYTNSLHTSKSLAFLHNINEILRFSRLADQYHSFILSYIRNLQLNWINYMHLLEATQFLKRVFTCQCSIVT